MSSGRYEFTQEQNAAIGDLAGKMKFVGFFSVAFGLLALLICLVTVAFIYRDRLPSGFREGAVKYYKQVQDSLPDDLKKQASDFAFDKIPTDNSFLTGVAIFAGVTGLIFFLQGVWTRSSARSFHKIVATQGNDISHLMHAIGSLRSMYGQVHLLLMAAVLGVLVAVGISLYRYYTG